MPEPDDTAELGHPGVTPGSPWAGTTVNSTTVRALVESVASSIAGAGVKGSITLRRVSVREALAWLDGFPGTTWQEKWQASSAEEDPRWSETIVEARTTVKGTQRARGWGIHGVTWLIAVDAIRPSYEWMHREHELLRSLPTIVLGGRDPVGAKAIADVIERDASSELLRQRYSSSAGFQLARILGHTGKQSLREVTPDDLTEARESARGQSQSIPSGAAYNAMSAAGFLPPDAPANFKDTLRTSQRSAEQLVDRTGIQSQTIRNLFVDYFRARTSSLDYTSLSGLVGKLVLNFWVEIEGLQPGIETLKLDSGLVAAWKERVKIIRHGNNAGKPRKDHGALLVAVRGFYYDINDWAQADPERYAAFAAPNPIGANDTKAFSKEKRRQRAVSHQRTRQRLPHLPTLMNAVTDQLRWHRLVLQTAEERDPGDRFNVEGITCEVAASAAAPFGAHPAGVKRMGGLMVRRLDTGSVFDAVQRETVYFWRWATFSVLKETGVRIEEMEELTHASITQYRLPSTGELLPLLQIAPSKTDKERVMLISPELADVLASIIARVRNFSNSGRIPLVARWDYQEKTLSEPMPFLFQRAVDGEDRPINRAWVLTNLRKTVDEIGLVDEAGEPIYFQNHDMRRIFATEAQMAGLPVHILANVMGHDSLDTTQIYTAIYEEDVYRRHRAFIERRRSIRPSMEYRAPTSDEFEEFLGHFERRQLELGICGRAYGTPCIHEHACIRCSMLQLDPKQAGRLQEIATNLEARIAEARAHRWHGEVEGLEVSLAGARQKLSSAERPPSERVPLGFPVVRTVET